MLSLRRLAAFLLLLVLCVNCVDSWSTTTTAHAELITDLVLISSSSSQDYYAQHLTTECPKGYVKNPQNLNEHAKGLPAVYLCTTTDSSFGEPITGITAAIGLAGQCPTTGGYQRLPVNANSQEFPVYLCVTRATGHAKQPQQGFGVTQIAFSKGKRKLLETDLGDCPSSDFLQLNVDFNAFEEHDDTTIGMCAMANFPAIPSKIHIALAGKDDGSSMAVSWQTDGVWSPSPTMNAKYNATVLYGTQSGKYDMQATGTTSHYFVSFQHDAVLTHLKSGGKTYYFIVGNDELGWSKEFSFKSAPDSTQATRDASFKFLLVGDMGLEVGDATRQLLKKRIPDNEFVLHIGDIGYADEPIATKSGKALPGIPNPYYEPILDAFMDEIEEIASQTPYMVCPGNHDGACDCVTPENCDKRTLNFTSYRRRWRMPCQESGAATSDSMWYSFNYENVHFVSIDTETDYPHAPSRPGIIFGPPGGPFGDQLAWLEQDLKAARQNEAQRPWIIVYGHRPLYSGKNNDFPFNAKKRTREAFEALFLKYGVDLFVAGHNHAYETIMPMQNNEICQEDYTDPKCPAYIVNGAAGNVESHSSYPNTMPKSTMFFDDEHYGWSEFTVVNSSHLYYAFVENEQGTILNDGYLIKTQH